MSVIEMARYKCVLGLVLPLCVTWCAAGQQLPPDWQQLDTPRFIEVARVGMENASLNGDALVAVRQNARDRLLKEGCIAGDNFYNIGRLLDFAKPVMTDEQIASVGQQIAARNDDPASMPFWNMQARVELLEQSNAPVEQVHELMQKWCDGNGQFIDASDRKKEGFNEAYEQGLFHYRVRWLLSRLRYKTIDSREFSATWTGMITAPRTGEYRFSTTPINPSFETPAEGQHYYQTLRVSIDGNQSLNAGWNDWKYLGTPVTLTANQPTPIKIEYVHSRIVGGPTDDHTSGNECPSALLYWEGPGISRGIVPSQAISASDGSGNGLLGTFQSSYGGQQVTKTSVDPSIDHVWISGICIVPQHLPQQRAVMDQVWQRYGNQSFVDRCRQQQLPYPLLADEMLVECLNREQRLAVVNWAAEAPDLVNSQSWKVVRQFFMNYRHDAPQEVLDVLGEWMVAHQDIVPDIGADFLVANRVQFRLLADALFVQYPPHAEQLETNYLVTENGQCVLPTAYTLGYGYLMVNKLEDWIKLLDDRLADDSLAGDRRVNWLIARAQAEELRDLHPGRNYVGHEELLAGRGWLDEAALVAENDELKLRVVNERLARLVGLNEWNAVDKEFAHMEEAFPRAQQAVASWKSTTDAMKSKIADRIESHRRVADQAYVDELTRRRDTAANRGEFNDVAAYEMILTGLGESRSANRD